MKKLIVNADGFGFTFGNNKAIFEILPRGFVKSVSVNVTWEAVKETPILARDFPHVTIGIHWNLSVGPPICDPKEIPSLVGTNGEFHNQDFPRRALKHQLNIEEMKRELRAQAKVLLDMGVPITHWDSHQSRHIYPGFFEAAIEVAKELGIMNARSNRYFLPFHKPRWLHRAMYYTRKPIRIITHWLGARKMKYFIQAGMRVPDYRVGIVTLGEGAEYRPDAWREMLSQLPEGISEIACHPGYPDDVLRKYSSMIESRYKELQFLKSDIPSRLAEEAGVESVSFAALDPSLRNHDKLRED